MTQAAGGSVAGVLDKTGVFTPEQLQAVLEEARSGECGVTEIVARRGFVREEDFLRKLAGVLRLEFRRLGALTVPKEVLERLPPKAVFQYNVVPVACENGVLLVASSDPLNAGLSDALRLASGLRVRFVLSPSADIGKAAKALYGVGAETLDRIRDDGRYEVEDAGGLDKLDVSELDQEASIVKFVNQIVREACHQGATDIHLEPMEKEFRVRYRVDGVLHQAPVPAQLHRFQAAIISRVKVMASLDIAEKRLPMDGRIRMRVDGQDMDIRVSTMPTVYGESVSLRLLQGGGEFLDFSELGMGDADARLTHKLIHRPNGIILVTGPTGSGKSTSLFAYLHELNKMDVRILTAENPIEYHMPGVNQVLVRPDIGLTFARALRSFLRQDPDIIMVGEVRDLETAEIAIQASLTGHLVFSTLHTNDAAGAFTRLLDMGVEPYLVASAVIGVVAQRLVRRLCPACRKEAAPEPALLREIGFPVGALERQAIYGPAGCESCRNTGYRGRVGLYEILQVTEGIESLVIGHRPASEIRQKAIAEGMRTLRSDGWAKVLDGRTSIDEVLRVSEESD